MDEHQEFVLFAREHVSMSFVGLPKSGRTKPKHGESFYFSSHDRSTRPDIGIPNNLSVIWRLKTHSRMSTSTCSPEHTAGACGGRTTRPSARAKTLSIDESWTGNGSTNGSPLRHSSRARK